MTSGARRAGGWRGVIEEYRSFLPVSAETPVVTLLEGGTPLLPAPALSQAVCAGRLRIFLKLEGLNPTGSFKDRGMTMAVSKALERGSRTVICASTGNTSASAAAYAGRAGLRCVVLLPHGKIALGKLSQAVMHGARVIAVRGSFDAALQLVVEISRTHPIALVNSLNPDRIEGQKTAAFEICDVLGDAPGYHCIPVGNAGNITAYWRGYKEYQAAGRTTSRPKMLGFQAHGAAPIVENRIFTDDELDTVATAIRIGNPASWQYATSARDESGGRIDKVSDAQILEAYCMLARVEGVFCEPASAASVAGLIQLCRQGYFNDAPPGAAVVCTITGHGLKDPATAMTAATEPEVVDAEIDSVRRALGL
jgi:threonine synthase